MTEIELQCSKCKYLYGKRKCRAFDFIPDNIFITGEFDHRNPHPGDNGIQYEPIEEEEE